MSKMGKSTSTRSSAGKKEAGSGLSKHSYLLKNKCRHLTVGDYIEMVCYDNLQPLVLEGKPTSKVLNEAKMAILQEYAELAGAGESQAGMAYKNIIELQANILAATTALQTFNGYFDDDLKARACKVLSKCGISTGTWGLQVTETQIKRATAELKAKQTLLEREIERYSKLAVEADGKKATEADIRREIVIVGGDSIIPDDCNLATYAVKVKTHRETIKAIERQKLTKKR